MSYIIIGNGPAAVFAIEGIRSKDKDTEIVIISKEKQYAYGRPTITYQIAGTVLKENMFLRDEAFYKKNNVQILFGKEAVSIDTKGKKVTLNSGESLSFSKLLIASGGTPFVPPTYSHVMDKDNVMTFIKWEDMEKLESQLKKIEKVMVIGGGLIGIKAAECLVQRGKKVYIAELAKRVLSTVVDEKGAEYFHKELEKNNVSLFLEDTVKEFKIEGNKVVSVSLNSGKNVDIDAVIVSIGVKPTLDFIKNNEIKVNKGIVVNDKQETSVSGIFSAGDVCEGPDYIFRDKRLGPIWLSASEQGKIAGINMAGGNETYKGRVIMNAISFMKTNLLSYGAINPEMEFSNVQFIEYERKDKNLFRRINVVDNKLVGAVYINSVFRKGIVTRFLKEGLPVDQHKNLLLSPELGFKSFDKNYRNSAINAVK